MSSVVSAAAGPVSRMWRLPNGVNVQLRTNTVLGDYSLAVDGHEIAEGRSTFISGKKLVQFSGRGGEGKGYIVIDPRMTQGVFAYSCWYGDPAVALVEENDTVGLAPTQIPGFDVAVTGVDVAMDEAGSQVVWFRVNTTRKADGMTTLVHRRHREFYALGETVLSAYRGSAVESTLPPLPRRTLPFLVNATDPVFLEQRRAELHNQVVKLEAVPRMRGNPEFHAFVGLVDNLREGSVVFGPGPLGMSLAHAGAFTQVEALKPLPDGGDGPAAKSGMVRVGSQVSKINGEDVIGSPYDEIVGKLKALPRPVVVHFLTGLSNPAAGEPGMITFENFTGTTVAASVPVSSAPEMSELA